MKSPVGALQENTRSNRHIDWDVTLIMDEGLMLRADVAADTSNLYQAG